MRALLCFLWLLPSVSLAQSVDLPFHEERVEYVLQPTDRDLGTAHLGEFNAGLLTLHRDAGMVDLTLYVDACGHFQPDVPGQMKCMAMPFEVTRLETRIELSERFPEGVRLTRAQGRSAWLGTEFHLIIFQLPSAKEPPLVTAVLMWPQGDQLQQITLKGHARDRQ